MPPVRSQDLRALIFTLKIQHFPPLSPHHTKLPLIKNRAVHFLIAPHFPNYRPVIDHFNHNVILSRPNETT